jgi:dihydroorotate dehydrogenase electron transfer subunit
MKPEVKQIKVKIKEIKKIKSDIFLLSFVSGHLLRTASPGNFIHIKVDSVILRRPFSIHMIKGNVIFVLFKVKGRGTKALAAYKKGKILDIIGPLGEGFKISHKTQITSHRNILVAGGIGVAPLMFLGGKLRNMQNVVLLGGKTKNEILCEKEFKKLGFIAEIATDDGSRGFKGTVTELLKRQLLAISYQQSANVYVCGPEAMLKAVYKIVKKYPHIKCQVSFEQFMGCGIGICCACTIETKHGYKKVCKDGPVFNIDEVW